MAELAALGIVIQVLDVSFKIIVRLNDYRKDKKGLPKAFQKIIDELPILQDTLEQLRSPLKSGCFEAKTRDSIIPVVYRCQKHIDTLHDILQKILPNDTDSKLWNQRKAIRSCCWESDIEKEMSCIRQLVQDLVLSSLIAKNFQDPALAKLRNWVASFNAADSSKFFWTNQEKRHENTGTWFLESEQYKSWIANPASILWLHGKAGSGKSVLSSSIVENMTQMSRGSPERTIAFFFFTFREDVFREPHEMVVSLIAQLAPRCTRSSADLNQLYTTSGNGTWRPSPSTARELLQLILKSLPEVYIIADALDECKQSERVVKVISNIIDWKLSNVHLLFTSRRETTFVKYFSTVLRPDQMIPLQNTIVDKDIQSFTRHRLAESNWKDDEQACAEIEAEICHKSDGMFRWAAFQIDDLCKCLTRTQLHETLKSLPKDLDETYDRILMSIHERNRRYAVTILRWLTFAKRPLSLSMLAEVVTTDHQREPAVNEDDRIRRPMDILDICGGLIMQISAQEDILGVFSIQKDVSLKLSAKSLVALSHFSVQEYLMSHRIQEGVVCEYYMDARDANAALAGDCISYLLHDQHYEARNLWDKSYESLPMVCYCLRYWDTHVRAAEPNGAVLMQLIIKLFQSDPDFLDWPEFDEEEHFEPLCYIHRDENPRGNHGPRLLLLAAIRGFPSLVQHLLCVDKGRSQPSTYFRRLSLAINRTMLSPMAVLLGKPWVFQSIFYFNGIEGHNELSLAISFMIIVYSLLGSPALFPAAAPAHMWAEKSGLALSFAIKSGHLSTVDVLLEGGARPDSTDEELFYSPLFVAVEQEDHRLLDRIIEAGAISHLGLALGKAIIEGSHHIFTIINSVPGAEAFRKYDGRVWAMRKLSRLVDLEQEGTLLVSVLHFTAAYGFQNYYDEETFQFLLSRGASAFVKTRNQHGLVPLHIAALRPHYECGREIRQLLDNQCILGTAQPHVLSLYEDRSYPFCWLELAVEMEASRLEEVLPIIVNNILKFSECEDDKWCFQNEFFSYALVLKGFLLQQDVEVNTTDYNENTALHLAALTNGYEAVVMLLKHGANRKARNNLGLTPLHLACRYGLSATEQNWTKIVPWPNKYAQTPKSIRYVWGLQPLQEFIVIALGVEGADVNTTANNGDTLLHDAVRSDGKTPLDLIQPDSPFLQVTFEKCPRLEFARSRAEEAYALKREILKANGALTSDELKQAEALVDEKESVDLCEEQIAMLEKSEKSEKSDKTTKTKEEDK